MNIQHYKILLSGVDKWNAWRQENPDVRPDNLMALCRRCHDRMGDRVEYKDSLQERHREVMAGWPKENP